MLDFKCTISYSRAMTPLDENRSLGIVEPLSVETVGQPVDLPLFSCDSCGEQFFQYLLADGKCPLCQPQDSLLPAALSEDVPHARLLKAEYDTVRSTERFHPAIKDTNIFIEVIYRWASFQKPTEISDWIRTQTGQVIHPGLLRRYFEADSPYLSIINRLRTELDDHVSTAPAASRYYRMLRLQEIIDATQDDKVKLQALQLAKKEHEKPVKIDKTVTHRHALDVVVRSIDQKNKAARRGVDIHKWLKQQHLQIPSGA